MQIHLFPCLHYPSCFATCSVYHILCLSFIKLLPGLLTVISSGWNLLARLCGTIIRAQLFLRQKFSYFIVVLPLKGVHYHKTHLLIWVTFDFLNIFEMRKKDLVKKAERLFSVRPMVFRKCGIKTARKVYILGKHLLFLPS